MPIPCMINYTSFWTIKIHSNYLQQANQKMSKLLSKVEWSELNLRKVIEFFLFTKHWAQKFCNFEFSKIFYIFNFKSCWNFQIKKKNLKS